MYSLTAYSVLSIVGKESSSTTLRQVNEAVFEAAAAAAAAANDELQ